MPGTQTGGSWISRGAGIDRVAGGLYPFAGDGSRNDLPRGRTPAGRARGALLAGYTAGQYLLGSAAVELARS